MTETMFDENIKIPDVLPVLPLRDVVAFPFIVLPLTVGRQKSLKAVDQAIANNRMILLLSQKDKEVMEPSSKDVYRIGTIAVVMRMLKLPDGNMKLIVQGIQRARVKRFKKNSNFLEASIEALPEVELDDIDLRTTALIRNVKTLFERSIALGHSVSSEVVLIINNLDDPGKLADLVASELNIKIADSQKVLETLDPVERLNAVNLQLSCEIELLSVQQEINTQTKGEIDRTQREYFLRQQLKSIMEELGDTGEMAEELEEFRVKIKKAEMPEEALEECTKQLSRLEKMNPDSSEANTIRGYLEWMTDIPWSVTTKDTLIIKEAEEILNEDHYGLEEVKDRIVEYLSVQKLKADHKAPILCFVGPPGVGKTSLGRSIARALGRKFIRISLGGVKDEAEVRGHRRTYVGALPGRIIQGMKQAGYVNPVFMLDEVDKIGSGGQGDPSSALLEVLDPEQNNSFRDNFLGVSYDLSKVMFITTANMLHPIQPAFRDRMEILELPGYMLEEKVQIALKYLIPRQIKENGLTKSNIKFSRKVLEDIITLYTEEAGVRNLERSIASICRKVARKIASNGKKGPYSIKKGNLEDYLGVPKVHKTGLLKRDEVGVVTGLAVTSVGGDILFVEAAFYPGGGQLILTGQLGETMQESAKAALSYTRTVAGNYKIDAKFFSSHDLHVHVPEGAVPKDGPSAGITMATAVFSACTGKAVAKNIAMTGEITLRGNVLAVGGVKEKVLAAKRAGITKIILPEQNRNELKSISDKLKEGLTFVLVETMNQVLDNVLIDGAKAAEK